MHSFHNEVKFYCRRLCEVVKPVINTPYFTIKCFEKCDMFVRVSVFVGEIRGHFKNAISFAI